jgi:hypothetical protein
MLSEEFVEDRLREVADTFVGDLKGVVEAAAFEAGVADPSSIVDDVIWWAELILEERFRYALSGKEPYA